MDAMLAEFGSIDILINNAGIARRKPAVDYSMEDWNTIMQVNLTSRVSNGAARRPRDDRERRAGKLSMSRRCSRIRAEFWFPPTPPRKAASRRSPWRWPTNGRPKGVNVNAIAPGYMSTDLTAALEADPVAETARSWIGFPPAVGDRRKILAGAAVFLASSASDYVHGAVLQSTADGSDDENGPSCSLSQLASSLGRGHHRQLAGRNAQRRRHTAQSLAESEKSERPRYRHHSRDAVFLHRSRKAPAVRIISR